MVGACIYESVQCNIRDGVISGAVGVSPMNRVGPLFTNIHLPVVEITRYIDPNNIANQTQLIDMDNVEKLYRRSESKSSSELPLSQAQGEK